MKRIIHIAILFTAALLAAVTCHAHGSSIPPPPDMEIR